ncbi:MAG TPA: hypothetical protein VIG06_24930 [Kofleriaceae bacterium]
MRRAALVLVMVGAFAPVARGEPRPMAEAARVHFDTGLRAYRARAWSEAIAEMRAGYAIDPHPDFLFPWAQATRLSGDCAGALPLYRRALDGAASEVDRRDIEVLIAGCERDVKRDRERSPPEPEAETEPEPTSAPPATRRVTHVEVQADAAAPPSPPWYADTLGGALAIGGALGLGAGAGFLVAAGRAEDDADSAATLDGFVSASDRADQRRLFGAVALGAGAGLAAVAVMRYAWVARRSSREVSVVLAPAPGGAALSLGGAF